jgi:hypothetical protein
MSEERTNGMWDLTPDQVELGRRITRIASRVAVVCLGVFVLCLAFVGYLPRPVYSVLTTLAEVVGGVAMFFAITGFVLDPRVRDFFDADNPAYRRRNDD